MGLNRALDLLYGKTSILELAKKTPDFDISKFDNAAKFVYENKGIAPDDLKKKAPRELLNEINKSFEKAVTEGIAENGLKYEVPATVTNALCENVWRFSGIKTYHQLKEASQLLVTENGQVKPFSQFKQDTFVL